MSDFAWIVFIIIIYLVVIRPMFQGAVNKPMQDQNKKSDLNRKPSSPNINSNKNAEGDYVDYEEIK